MEFQPANLFVRGAEEFGGLITLVDRITMYKYLSSMFHRDIIADPRVLLRRRGPVFMTTYRYYTPVEALRALALPGPLPSHVVEIDLKSGAVLQGPAFVNPLSLADVKSLKSEHRCGNGIEFLLWTPLSRCLAGPPRVASL